MQVHIYSHKYSWNWGRRAVWVQEFETSLSNIVKSHRKKAKIRNKQSQINNNKPHKPKLMKNKTDIELSPVTILKFSPEVWPSWWTYIFRTVLLPFVLLSTFVSPLLPLTRCCQMPWEVQLYALCLLSILQLPLRIFTKARNYARLTWYILGEHDSPLLDSHCANLKAHKLSLRNSV